MKFVLFFIRQNRPLVALSAFFGLLGGLANALIITLISENLGKIGAGAESGWKTFLFAIGATFLTQLATQGCLLVLSSRLTTNLRLNMSQDILDLPMRKIEEVGLARLAATFTYDIGTISGAVLRVPALFINGAIALGCLGYMGWLSLPILGFFLIFVVLIVLSYFIPERLALSFVVRTRKAWDNLFKQFTALNEGIKELKLHYRRRDQFLTRTLRDAVFEMRDSAVKETMIFAGINNITQLLYLFFIGSLLFIFPHFQELTPKVVTAFTLIILYVRPPIVTLIDTLPAFRRANVSFDAIDKIGLKLVGGTSADPFPNRATMLARIEAMADFRSLRLVGVTHSFYRERESSHFTLGPIDLELGAGEIVFVIGGNGSGKTTLAKILVGLYQPESGEVLVNGQAVVSDEDWEAYRQYFSAIFSNFYIFEEILGMEGEDLDQRAQEILARLHLDHKVTIADGVISTKDLSAGQSKRLALMAAYLENRPIALFDEWAADQDPEFKEVFYHELLPEMKRRGKTAIVISHDDRYFGVADRIIKLQDGAQVEA